MTKHELHRELLLNEENLDLKDFVFGLIDEFDVEEELESTQVSGLIAMDQPTPTAKPNKQTTSAEPKNV